MDHLLSKERDDAGPDGLRRYEILFDLTRLSVGVCLLSGFEGSAPLRPLLFENWILQKTCSFCQRCGMKRALPLSLYAMLMRIKNRNVDLRWR